MADISIKFMSRLCDIHPRLTLRQVMQFVTLARSLKDDIILTQPAVIPASDPPEILPPSVKTFLEDSCKISEECVEDCWEVLRSTIWGVGVNREQDFAEHGHSRGLTSRTLYPPCQTCSNLDCSRNKKGQLLKKAEQRQAVLYTLGEEALPVYAVHLYCESCNINYHHNYSVEKDKRTYYDGIPEIIQVGEHQFMERKLIQLWITMMLVSWTSATNCARMYNLTLSNTVPPDDWAFGFTVRTEHVWDAFVILSLMEDFERRSKTLVIPHTGAQKDRFINALQERNIRFRLYSQPEDVERIHRERGQARFQLKERLQRARVAHPNDATAVDTDLSNLAEDNEEEEEFDLPDRDGQRELATSETHRNVQTKKVRAQFGRKRSHNEQIIVAPCGMIIARETFYGAEGVASVIEMIKRTFHEDIKPDHIFFDNNCTLAKMVKDDPYFDSIGLSVDVFHFKCKHSETDQFCQLNCNPAAFPELESEDHKGWYFNSSIAEQTNVWLGGYHAICREMLRDKYMFFLDEMIVRRNRATRYKLEKEGHGPQTWPVVS
ncbi:hypothetical protein FPV67DRAFT_1677039 [Lyophyllum atratum]|nr:hypothetical protein FPV67DRAFT_1677039 [Lyophyllum atratum]